jgi:DNA-directed RNA polymerase subunit RPC12/RpoP/nitrate reductase NapE component
MALLIFLKFKLRAVEYGPASQEKRAEWRKLCIKVVLLYPIIAARFAFGIVSQNMQQNVQRKHVSVVPFIIILIIAGGHSYVSIFCTFFCSTCGRKIRVIPWLKRKVICPCGSLVLHG